MRIEDLNDRPVMSIAAGTKLGSVHDFLLDDSYLHPELTGHGAGVRDSRSEEKRT